MSSMRTHLFMTAVAASILLTSAAFAASSTTPLHVRRAGDRYTIMTGNRELMCKVAGNESSPGWAPPPQWANAIAYLRQEGEIRCTPSMINGSGLFHP